MARKSIPKAPLKTGDIDEQISARLDLLDNRRNKESRAPSLPWRLDWTLSDWSVRAKRSSNEELKATSPIRFALKEKIIIGSMFIPWGRPPRAYFLYPTFGELLEVFPYSRRTLAESLKELRKAKLIAVDNRGYYPTPEGLEFYGLCVEIHFPHTLIKLGYITPGTLKRKPLPKPLANLLKAMSEYAVWHMANDKRRLELSLDIGPVDKPLGKTATIEFSGKEQIPPNVRRYLNRLREKGKRVRGRARLTVERPKGKKPKHSIKQLTHPQRKLHKARGS